MENDEYIRKKQMEWIKDLINNPDKLSFFKKRASAYNVSVKDFIEFWDNQKGVCALCGDSLVFDSTTHIDHIIPRKLNGKDEIKNYQYVCAKCNYAKRDLPTRDFIIMCMKIQAKNKYVISKMETMGILDKIYKNENIRMIEERKEWNRQYKGELKKNKDVI